MLAAGQAYRVALARMYDLHVIDMTAVEIIGQSSRPLTQQQLSIRLASSPGTLTAVVDRLEAAGFVERRRHPVDRRARLIALTDDGTALVAFSDRCLRATLTSADADRLTESGAGLGSLIEQISMRLESEIRGLATSARSRLRIEKNPDLAD